MVCACRLIQTAEAILSEERTAWISTAQQADADEQQQEGKRTRTSVDDSSSSSTRGGGGKASSKVAPKPR